MLLAHVLNCERRQVQTLYRPTGAHAQCEAPRSASFHCTWIEKESNELKFGDESALNHWIQHRRRPPEGIHPRGLTSSLLLLACLQGIEVELASGRIAAFHALGELILLYLASTRRWGRGWCSLMTMHHLGLARPHHSIHRPVRNTHAHARGHTGRHGTHQAGHHTSAASG